MKGIENWFALEKIFGEDVTLSDSIIENAILDAIGGKMSLEMIVDCEVKNPPSKWTAWEKVYLKIDFFCIRVAQSAVNNGPFEINVFTISETGDGYELNIESKENDKINCVFAAGRIQNIKPFVYNPKTNRYEVNG
ncbi:MAG: immunity 50 family protein [bacterium]|nr:immunity 50 family protein [bacterium]